MDPLIRGGPLVDPQRMRAGRPSSEPCPRAPTALVRPARGAGRGPARGIRALARPGRWLGLTTVLGLSAGCAGPRTEWNLAPVVSRHSAAGGDSEVEAIGGMVLSRRDAFSGERNYWAVRPLVSNRYEPDGDRLTWFLRPFGFAREDAAQKSNVAQLVPLARYAQRELDSGFVEWSLLVLPGIYWGSKEDGSVQRVFFPLGGVAERFFGFDRIRFVLFPLWLRTERHGRTTDHFPFPLFSYGRGAGGKSWRIWPLAGRVAWEGRYVRRFFLWPFFHVQSNELQRPPSEHQHTWMIWPLFGRARRGEARVTTVLWPFFGHTTDPDTGFWAWDAPWPLVVFQGGDPNRARRERVWPFYSRYEGDGLIRYWHPFPFVSRRYETYSDGELKGFAVYPFWRSYNRTLTGTAAPRRGEGPGEAEGGTPPSRPGVERWRKLWPLFRWRSGPSGGHAATPDLNPFQELDFLDEHYAWLWELYSRTTTVSTLRTRSWLGLWRRERDADEDRRALSVLWSARDYTRAGRDVSERSWLFGLVRYRVTEGEGWRMLRPAFPGPGWPLQRVPRSTLPEALPLDATPGGPAR
jgi:hypothetical protein